MSSKQIFILSFSLHILWATFSIREVFPQRRGEMIIVLTNDLKLQINRDVSSSLSVKFSKSVDFP
jgi:hypothetical protein